MKDLIDAPPPQQQVWSGRDGEWLAESDTWRVDNQQQGYDRKRYTVFTDHQQTVKVGPSGNDDRSVIVTNGLSVSDGTHLVFHQHRISNKYHFRSAKNATYTITLHSKSPGEAGKRGAYITSAGSGFIEGGTLIVKVEDGLPIGQRRGLRANNYGLIRVDGVRQGDFDRIIVPEGTTAKWIGKVLCLEVPHVLTAGEEQRLKKNLRGKLKKELKRSDDLSTLIRRS